jgi:putative transposase
VARYRFITEHRAHWGVEEMCKVLEVSRGGYYDWKKRLPSQRVQQRQRLDVVITTLFEVSKKRFGSPKITRELMKQGWRVSESHVARCMRELGLSSIVRRRFRVTTDSKHRYPVDRIFCSATSPPSAKIRCG